MRYQYPDDVTPAGSTPRDYLRQLVGKGKRRRWLQGCPDKVRAQIEHELALIGEPPDIDVDFEHERREEVIQYIYRKYGRERAALAASVITYRARSALRDTARALGFSAQQVEQLVSAASGWRCRGEVAGEWLREAGFDPDAPGIRRLLALVNELLGFPRHLSQHVGGFVIARDSLLDLVPVENAAMPERTIIQWDKDDLESLGLLKVDVLALGMLSAIRKALALLAAYYQGTPCPQVPRALQEIPAEDPETYAMIRRADTMGVFQIESRAQMSMLPRLKPACFYDLVVEVAIVRPGPIQGDMVHPYLRRRQGVEPVSYPSKAVKSVLERTLGVPIFQEQVIKLAMVAAGFSPGEADRLRRSMAAWRRRGGLAVWERKLKEGMRERGYDAEFADRIFRQILGFVEYGFPESHAASFALLVYFSAWLKCYHPAVFCAALLNSQPMGFYAPAQLVRDVREHGVTVLPVEVNCSDWDCTLEEREDGPALRLGLRLVKGLSRSGARRLEAARRQGHFRSVDELARRAQLNRADLKALAAADALARLAMDRHQASWAVAGVEAPLPLLEESGFAEARPELSPPTLVEEVTADYARLGLSLRAHPLALLRPELGRLRFIPAEEVARRQAGLMVRAAGLVLVRQRPGKGNAVFITLEDETGSLNLIVWRQLAERQRRVLLQARLLGGWAEIQRADGVQHLIVRRLYDYSHLLTELPVRSRDFH